MSEARSYSQKPPIDEAGVIRMKIADLAIAFFTRDPQLKLGGGGIIDRFITNDSNADVSISVAYADSFNDSNGNLLFDSGGLWRLFQEGDKYRFEFYSPLFGQTPYTIAIFNNDFAVGEVYLRRTCFQQQDPIYPLAYPLDELLLMHLLANGRGAELHASGIVDETGKGLLFIGQSGAGKSTVASMWQKISGVNVLSDDRIIVRKIGDRFYMYGTPWHGEAQLAMPNHAELSRIFFLRQARSNEIKELNFGEAVAKFFACGFPPFYSSAGLEFTLSFYEAAARALPCCELNFTREEGLCDFINRTVAR